MREQEGWDEHARFMDALVDEGFVLLSGPLEGDREALLIVDAPSEEAVRERLAADAATADPHLAAARPEPAGVSSHRRFTIRLSTDAPCRR